MPVPSRMTRGRQFAAADSKRVFSAASAAARKALPSNTSAMLKAAATLSAAVKQLDSIYDAAVAGSVDKAEGQLASKYSQSLSRAQRWIKTAAEALDEAGKNLAV